MVQVARDLTIAEKVADAKVPEMVSQEALFVQASEIMQRKAQVRAVVWALLTVATALSLVACVWLAAFGVLTAWQWPAFWAGLLLLALAAAPRGVG